MSFLLDALRKSEHDRRIGEVPKLIPDLAIDARSLRPKRYRFEFLVLILVLVNVGTLLYVASQDPAGPMEAKKTPGPSTVNPEVPVAAGQAGSSANSKRAGKIETRAESDWNAKSRASLKTSSPERLADLVPKGPDPKGPPSGQAQIARVPPEIPGNPAREPLTEPRPVSESARPAQTLVNTRARQPVKKAPLAVPSEPIELKGPVSSKVKPDQASPPVTDTPSGDPPAPLSSESGINSPANPGTDSIPLLTKMPREFQREVPSLKINVFAYSENPEERFVIINMSKYRAGQKIDSGPEILEIRADSLVLEYLSTKFRVGRR